MTTFLKSYSIFHTWPWIMRWYFVMLQPHPTAELDRSGDQVYTGIMAMVKQVVQLKNDVNTLPVSEYPQAVKVQ